MYSKGSTPAHMYFSYIIPAVCTTCSINTNNSGTSGKVSNLIDLITTPWSSPSNIEY